MSAPPPTVSVVIPVRDDDLHLERCLEALHGQSDAPDEVVVVDNGGSDLTPIIASWWRARCIPEPRLGIAPAATAGYDAAAGDIIARLDADSVPGPDWVSRLRAALAPGAGADAVTGPGRFDELGPIARRAAEIGYMRAYFTVFGVMAGRTPLFGSSFAMTRATWRDARERVHAADRHVHDDLDLSFSLGSGTVVRLDPRLGVHVSARPFIDPVAFARRIGRGVYTVGVNRRRIGPRSDRPPKLTRPITALSKEN